MKLRSILVFLFILPGAFLQAKVPLQNFDRAVFYATMASGIMEDIDKQLTLLDLAQIQEKEAYEGAMLMRKSGLLKKAAEKLKFFKKGRIKLETAIAKDGSNAEYRFLRLAIEEHAPKVVKYKADLESDKRSVIDSFQSLSAVVQQAIIDYSKNSRILHPKDL